MTSKSRVIGLVRDFFFGILLYYLPSPSLRTLAGGDQEAPWGALHPQRGEGHVRVHVVRGRNLIGFARQNAIPPAVPTRSGASLWRIRASHPVANKGS